MLLRILRMFGPRPTYRYPFSLTLILGEFVPLARPTIGLQCPNAPLFPLLQLSSSKYTPVAVITELLVPRLPRSLRTLHPRLH